MQVTRDREESNLLSVLVRERLLLVRLPLIFLVIGGMYLVLRSDRYVSESRVRPFSNQNQNNRLSGIAAQFGFALPNSGDPIRMYGEIAASNSLMKDVLLSAYKIRDENGAVAERRLIDVIRPRGNDEDARLRKAVDDLRKRVDVSPNEATGIIRLRVVLRNPDLSEQVNRRILGLIDSTSMRVRQGQASSEAKFVAARLAQAQSELLQAEQALEQFLRTNRAYENSPQLAAEHARLQRIVDFRQQVAVSLAQSFEQARIDEVRNTPVLGVIDPPEGTAKKANRTRDIVIWPLAGLLVALAIALVKEAMRQSMVRHPAEWEQVRSMLRFGRSARGAREHAA